jgi:hypothetical protein
MEFTAGDEVQLGSFDVPARVLAAAGVPLTELVGDQGAASVSTMMGTVPIDGWRVIGSGLPSESGEVLVVVAPWQGPPWDHGAPNGWMTVRFTRRNGRWSSCLDGDQIPVRPGRRHRRAGLQLRWPSSLIEVTAGNVPDVRLSLCNAAPARWQPDGIDHGNVRAWAVGGDGQPLPRRAWSMEAFQFNRFAKSIQARRWISRRPGTPTSPCCLQATTRSWLCCTTCSYGAFLPR